MSVPIIFIWVNSKLPSYAYDSLRFCNDANPSREIFLLTNASNYGIAQGFATIFQIGEVEISKLNSFLPKMQFKGDFWINTSLRFLILERFLRDFKIQSFYHAELDNVIFNLDGIDHVLNGVGKGIFVPRDSEDRAIASLLFCNRPESISELIEIYVSSNPPPLHDMDALGKYANMHRSYFFALPTESFQKNSEIWNVVSPQKLGGIFDAAAIGQYLLGVDTIHCRFKPCKNGFMNENCNIDLGSVDFIVKDAKILIRFRSSKTEFQIHNIHLHSKNFAAFNEIMNNGKILTKLNMGEISIISNHHMVFLGPIFFAAHKLVDSINRVLKKTLQRIFSDD